MFRGEYSHSIDSKGRIIIPSKLRASLGDTFVLTKGLDGCLMAYATEDWEEFESKLREGRVLIPTNLREYSGLTREAVLLGMGNRIEIWSKDKYETEGTYDDMDEVAGALEDMGLGI